MKKSNSSYAIYPPAVMIIYQIVVSSIILTGIVLNVVVIYIYRINRVRKSLFNYCLVHLSAANTAQLFGAIPNLIDIRHVEVRNKVFGSFLCGVFHGNSLFFSFAFTTIGLLSFISFTRYIAIAYPLRKIKKKTSKRLIVILWFLGLVWLVPNYFRMHMIPNESFCDTNPDYKSINVLYISLSFLLTIVTPVLVTVITFGMTTYQFYKGNNYRKNGGKSRSNTNIGKVRYRRKVLILLGSLIGVFILCWLPHGIFLSSIKMIGDDVQGEYIKVRVGRITIIPCLLASTLNVIFYTLRSAEFKSAIRGTLFGKLFQSVRKSDRTSTSESFGANR